MLNTLGQNMKKFNGVIPVRRLVNENCRSSGQGGQRNAKFSAPFHLSTAEWLPEGSSSAEIHKTKLTKDECLTIRPDKNSIDEPPYLDDLKPKVGYYDLLNLQLKGYDFVVLEKYQSYVHKTMRKMQFNVVKAWSVPYQELQLETLQDRSTAVENTAKIKIYERNIQMKDALVTKLPLLIDIINMTTPPGVSFNIHRHTSADDDRIYFRDSVLEKLKEDLQELKDTPLIGVA